MKFISLLICITTLCYKTNARNVYNPDHPDNEDLISNTPNNVGSTAVQDDFIKGVQMRKRRGILVSLLSGIRNVAKLPEKMVNGALDHANDTFDSTNWFLNLKNMLVTLADQGMDFLIPILEQSKPFIRRLNSNNYDDPLVEFKVLLPLGVAIAGAAMQEAGGFLITKWNMQEYASKQLSLAAQLKPNTSDHLSAQKNASYRSLIPQMDNYEDVMFFKSFQQEEITPLTTENEQRISDDGDHVREKRQLGLVLLTVKGLRFLNIIRNTGIIEFVGKSIFPIGMIAAGGFVQGFARFLMYYL